MGYVIAIYPQFCESIQKHRMIALLLGIVAITYGVFLVLGGYSTRSYLFAFLRGFNSWFWIVAILGFGRRCLNFNNKVLKYSNEDVLPFYILHQTVIVIIGFLIAGWGIGVLPKYLVLGTISFILIIGIYDQVVNRVKVLRFLFGMKGERRRQSHKY